MSTIYCMTPTCPVHFPVQKPWKRRDISCYFHVCIENCLSSTKITLLGATFSSMGNFCFCDHVKKRLHDTKFDFLSEKYGLFLPDANVPKHIIYLLWGVSYFAALNYNLTLQTVHRGCWKICILSIISIEYMIAIGEGDGNQFDYRSSW